MKDPYETLGVNRTATDVEIKDAFKKLARKFHPDLHPDDKDAEAKFKDLSAANDFLKDKEKRRRFDAGEIDATGLERPQERFYRDFADGPAYASHAAQDGFGPISVAGVASDCIDDLSCSSAIICTVSIEFLESRLL